MWRTKPISLTLVLLLAFWTPVGACCDGGSSAAAQGAAARDATAVLSCHDHAGPKAPESDATDRPEPCEEQRCDCESPALGACQRQAEEIKLPASSTSRLLDSLLALAPIQPQTLLPHTFFERYSAFEDAAFRDAPARTLLSQSCQLTL